MMHASQRTRVMSKSCVLKTMRKMLFKPNMYDFAAEFVVYINTVNIAS